MGSISLVTRLTVMVHLAVLDGLASLRSERGQTSAEYALVLLGAGAVALLLLGWATSTGKVSKLLDTVFNKLVKYVP